MEGGNMNVVIFSSDQDVEEYKSYLTADFPDVTFMATRNEAEALDYAENADVLVALRFSNELLVRAKKLKWIQSIIAGTDYIENLPEFGARKDILLTSSRGIHGPQVSELVILFMIALNRRFPQFVRNQDSRTWERWPATLMHQKKVAILGMGTIGQSLARKCKAFDMTVYGIGPNPKQLDVLDDFFLTSETNRVAAQVDYFVSTAPGTSSNREVLNVAFFEAMKPTAFFINVGRGEVVDEAALVEALRSNAIAGAGLDCFQQEPLPPDHPLWSLDNVIMTPHVGGMCDIYIQQAVRIFHENLKCYLAGERENLINLVVRK
jgi:D-2-hydroxyacid dehydrogenase (NADP+)